MNEKPQLLAALGKVASGLFILTARRGKDETGLLVSWVQQCSFEPPQLTIALREGRYVADWLAAGAILTLNVLDETQTDMISHFGRGFEAGEPAFEGLELSRRTDRPPILNEALAYLDGEVAARHPCGDHTLFVVRLLEGRLLNDGRPMTHVRKSAGHY